MEKSSLPYASDNLTARPLEHYLARFRLADTAEIAARTGVSIEGHTLTLTLLGEPRRVTWPDFTDDGWSDRDRILALRFLLDGKRPGASDAFLTYRELPWGETYDRQFHARCINRLAGVYGRRAEAFAEGCRRLGGVPSGRTGTGYTVEFMPGLRVQLLLWEADEEFPASAQILFSDNFPAAFSAEDCVYVCEYILKRL